MIEWITVVVTSVTTSVLASAIFFVVLGVFRPNIKISKEICLKNENGKNIMRIKIVNNSRAMLTEVKYSLAFCQTLGAGVYICTEIPAAKTPLFMIDKYSKKDTEYAVRITYELPQGVDLFKDKCWLEFLISANHGFSNRPKCVKMKYTKDKIVKNGIFETGKSTKALTT